MVKVMVYNIKGRGFDSCHVQVFLGPMRREPPKLSFGLKLSHKQLPRMHGPVRRFLHFVHDLLGYFLFTLRSGVSLDYY